jgi:hypothetical protein
MSGVIRIDKRDVPYEGPYIRAEGREIAVAMVGDLVGLPAAAPIMKRGDRSARAILADGPTFGSLQASREIATWLPEALYILGEVIDAALRPPAAAGPGEPAVTADQRLMAVAISVDEFKAELVTRVGQAVTSVLEADVPAAPAKSDPLARLRGLL